MLFRSISHFPKKTEPQLESSTRARPGVEERTLKCNLRAPHQHQLGHVAQPTYSLAPTVCTLHTNGQHIQKNTRDTATHPHASTRGAHPRAQRAPSFAFKGPGGCGSPRGPAGPHRANLARLPRRPAPPPAAGRDGGGGAGGPARPGPGCAAASRPAGWLAGSPAGSGRRSGRCAHPAAPPALPPQGS